MSSILQDERFKWIRQRVVLSLEIPTAVFDEYFTDSLERARSAGIARETAADYLSKNHGTGSALFFACSKTSEEVEGIYLI